MKSEAEARAEAGRLLESSRGQHWRFEHCGRAWDVNENFRPAIVCPECGSTMSSKRLFPLGKEVRY
jgi:hypothetical protein